MNVVYDPMNGIVLPDGKIEAWWLSEYQKNPNQTIAVASDFMVIMLQTLIFENKIPYENVTIEYNGVVHKTDNVRGFETLEYNGVAKIIERGFEAALSNLKPQS